MNNSQEIAQEILRYAVNLQSRNSYFTQIAVENEEHAKEIAQHFLYFVSNLLQYLGFHPLSIRDLERLDEMIEFKLLPPNIPPKYYSLYGASNILEGVRSCDPKKVFTKYFAEAII